MKTTYIKSVQTVNTGGGCMVDYVILADGHVIGLNDDCVVLYASMDDALSGENNNRPAFEIPSVKG